VEVGCVAGDVEGLPLGVNFVRCTGCCSVVL
jgi:hypothetical protein